MASHGRAAGKCRCSGKLLDPPGQHPCAQEWSIPVPGDTACQETTWQGREGMEELHCQKVVPEGGKGQDTKEDFGNTAQACRDDVKVKPQLELGIERNMKGSKKSFCCCVGDQRLSKEKTQLLPALIRPNCGDSWSLTTRCQVTMDPRKEEALAASVSPAWGGWVGLEPSSGPFSPGLSWQPMIALRYLGTKKSKKECLHKK